jgi:hypothetical protein
VINRQRLSEFVQLPSRRQLRMTLGAGAALALICWYFGVDVWHSILLGCALIVIGFACLVGSNSADAHELNWHPGRRSSREGSRNEIANLSRGLRSGWGFIGLTADRRLHVIASRRLALEGLDLSNPQDQLAIEQLIGPQAYRILRSNSGRLPTLRALLHCLDMLDATDSTHYPQPQPPSRRWGRGPSPFSLRRARER